MSAYDWIFFKMQLVSHGCQLEDVSETEPILSQSTTVGSSKDNLSSCEIRFVGADDDCQNLDSHEQNNLVNADQPQCRICLDNGECRAVFILRANVPPDRWWLRLKFQLLVVRDHTLIFVIVQLVVAFMGMLVYRFYGEELREMFGYEEHPYGFYSMAILAVILVGLLYGFFMAIICGQRISERHYHVLAKQELTKEYVVENRDENEDMPELDPNHVTELRMLGLY